MMMSRDWNMLKVIVRWMCNARLLNKYGAARHISEVNEGRQWPNG